MVFGGSVASLVNPRKPPITSALPFVGESNGESLPAGLSGTIGFLSARPRNIRAAIVGLGVPMLHVKARLWLIAWKDSGRGEWRGE